MFNCDIQKVYTDTLLKLDGVYQIKSSWDSIHMNVSGRFDVSYYLS